MISASHNVNSQQTMGVPATKEVSASTAAKDVKFGDKFRSVYPVVDKKILKEAVKAIESDSGYFVADSSKSSMKSRICSQVTSRINNRSQYVLPLIPETTETKTNVQFDKHCRIVDRQNFEHQLETHDPALIKLARKCVETLARQFSLHGQSLDIFQLLIIRNYISSEGLRGGRWHRDGGDYSLVMLMNDDSVINKEKAAYYTGGGLETAKFARRSLDEGTLATEGTAEYHAYRKNGGYAFSNQYGLVHRGADGKYVQVETGKPLDKPLEKMLMLVILSHPK